MHGSFGFSGGPFSPAFANYTFTLTVDGTEAAVLVPATLALIGLSLAGLGFTRRKK